MNCCCGKCKLCLWRAYYYRNRDRINKLTRERRAKAKALKMQGKHCLLCGMRMVYNSYYTRVYCRDCVIRFPIQVRRHKYRRYWAERTKPKETVSPRN